MQSWYKSWLRNRNKSIRGNWVQGKSFVLELWARKLWLPLENHSRWSKHESRKIHRNTGFSSNFLSSISLEAAQLQLSYTYCFYPLFYEMCANVSTLLFLTRSQLWFTQQLHLLQLCLICLVHYTNAKLRERKWLIWDDTQHTDRIEHANEIENYALIAFRRGNTYAVANANNNSAPFL